MENQEIKSMEENEQSSDKLKNLINKYKEQNTITIKSQKKIQAVLFIYNLLYHIIIIYFRRLIWQNCVIINCLEIML